MKNVGITPLFERLIDENSNELFEESSRQFLSLTQLQNSIMKDLSYLLNTRVSNSWKKCSTSAVTVPYSYGVNVTAPQYAENVFEIQEIESRIDDAIKQFEPRLIDAKSKVVGADKDPCILHINIDALVIIRNHMVPLSFPVVMDV